MLRLPLLLLAVTAPALAQEAELVATFDRSTESREALRVLHGLALDPAPGGVEFGPVQLSAPLPSSPSAETLAAVFASGAVSVEVVRSAAQLAAAGVPERVDEIERKWPASFPRYYVSVSYPSTTPTPDAEDAFESALGTPPQSVTKRANEVRIRLPRSEATAAAARLRSVPTVVAVHVE